MSDEHYICSHARCRRRREHPGRSTDLQDPKEETDLNTIASWARTPIRRMIQEFQDSLKKNPPIPPGAPDAFCLLPSAF